MNHLKRLSLTIIFAFGCRERPGDEHIPVQTKNSALVAPSQPSPLPAPKNTEITEKPPQAETHSDPIPAPPTATAPIAATTTQSIQSIIDSHHRQVVHLRSNRTRPMGPAKALGINDPHALGSGVIVSADGLIATLTSFKTNNSELTALFADGTRTTLTPVPTQSPSFIAFFKSEHHSEAQDVANLKKADALQVGSTVTSLARPTEDQEIAVSRSIIASLSLQSKPALDKNLILLDSSQCALTEGGPLIDDEGHTIGIIYQHSPQQCAALPLISSDIPLSDDPIPAKRPWLGMVVTPLEGSSGAKVTTLTPGGPAEDSGLLVDDVILRFDGKEVDQTSIAGWSSSTLIDVPISISLLREGKEQTLELIPKAQPAD